MRKHHVVATIGILAILATFLVPGLAFGQGTEPQGGQITIGCPDPGAGLSLSATPVDVTFTATAAPGVGNPAASSLDMAIVATDTLPDNHVITISDSRSGQTDGCPATTPGMQLTVSSTELTGPLANTIPTSAIHIVTTNRHGITGVADDLASTGVPKYSAIAGTGMAHDAVLSYGVNTGLMTPATYTTDLSAGRTLLTKATGTYGDISVGVALAIVEGIAANQYPGTYTGIITYSLSQL